MDLIEIIGLVVLVLAMFSPLLKRLFERRDKKKHPEAYKRKQEEREAQSRKIMQQILGEVPHEEIPEELEIEIPVVVPKEKAGPFEPIIHHDESYAIYKKGTSSIKKLLQEEGSKQNMILLYEVLSPPVSMRE